MIEIGSPAPEFNLLDSTRAVKTLNDFKGRNTVLAFYPGAFTGVCDSEMCALRDSMTELNQLNAHVVGISVDSPFANAAFASHHSLEFPLLSDFTRETIKTYDVLLNDFAGLSGYNVAQRSVFVLDAEGVVRYKWIAEKPGIEPDYDELKAELAKLA